MKFIPILYSTPMVQGVLDNRKDRTRRTKGLELINDRPNEFIRLDGYHQDDIPRPARKYDDRFYYAFTGKRSNMVTTVVHCPYGKPGDILWVREKTCYVHLEHAHDLLEGFREKRQTIYGTDMHEDWMKYAKEKYGYKWKPSLFMPKSDCRIFLKVKSVRVERLQDISEEDSKAEGVLDMFYGKDIAGNAYFNYIDKKGGWDSVADDAKHSFQTLWQSINGEQSWDDNPWVWVIEFERIELTEHQKQIFHSKK